MVNELKTLKDIREKAAETCLTTELTNPLVIGDYFVRYNSLKAEAVKWVKQLDFEISNYYKDMNRGLKRKVIKNKMTNAQRWQIKKWIIHFFNLTEGDLK